jgi:transposase
VTLQLLWREYLDDAPEGYRYTQFVARFRAWQRAHQAPRLRREHRPGEAVEVDYAGMTLTVGVGDAAGPAQVFVAVLPYSGLVFADVTWSQRSADWLASHVRLFEALGGVPARLVPDNLKVGVSHASFYDPAINADYLTLARHYGTAVIPTRVRKPRDKASVENGVLQVERRVLAVLRDRVFADLAEARTAVREQIDALNAEPLRSLADRSRQALFAEIERGALQALPSAPFVIGTWSRGKVRAHYHVTVDGVAYSIPHRLIGAVVDVHAGPAVIQVFHRGDRVACHRRRVAGEDPRAGGDRVTLDAHKPANHKAMADYTPERVAAELAAIGPAAARFYRRIPVVRVQRKMPSVERLAHHCLFDLVGRLVRTLGCQAFGSAHRPMPTTPCRRRARGAGCCASPRCTAAPASKPPARPRSRPMSAPTPMSAAPSSVWTRCRPNPAAPASTPTCAARATTTDPRKPCSATTSPTARACRSTSWWRC